MNRLRNPCALPRTREPASGAPGRPPESALVLGAAVDRLAVGHDDELERQLEQLAQRGQDALLVPVRRPDAKLAIWRGQPVGEDKGALLGQVERGLLAPATVVERPQPARQLAPRSDRHELGLRDVVAEEEIRAKSPDAVPLDEAVDV